MQPSALDVIALLPLSLPICLFAYLPICLLIAYRALIHPYVVWNPVSPCPRVHVSRVNDMSWDRLSDRQVVLKS